MFDARAFENFVSSLRFKSFVFRRWRIDIRHAYFFSAEACNVIYLPQAAEKALKAAQYTLHAEKAVDHNLNRICNGLNDAEIANFASQFERLVGGSARMRYPDCFTCPQIPHEVYSSQQARESLHLATEIVRRVKPKIDKVLKDRRY